MQVAAPAKINLTLDVLDVLPSGYHSLRTVMQTIDLCDRLTVELTEHVGSVDLTVIDCGHGLAPAGSENIAAQAASAILSRVPARVGVRIALEKAIPLQAGLGGGSSDAAATLTALNTLLGAPLNHAQLTEMALSLGADVPFFLTGGRCVVEGIGERVTPMPDGERWPVVIVKPPVGVSTASAYAWLDRARGADCAPKSAPWDGVSLRNDFSEVVSAETPAVALALAVLRETGCTQAQLCGSGSAVFGVTDPGLSRDEARARVMRIADGVAAAGVGAVMVAWTVGRAELSRL